MAVYSKSAGLESENRSPEFQIIVDRIGQYPQYNVNGLYNRWRMTKIYPKHLKDKIKTKHRMRMSDPIDQEQIERMSGPRPHTFLVVNRHIEGQSLFNKVSQVRVALSRYVISAILMIIFVPLVLSVVPATLNQIGIGWANMLMALLCIVFVVSGHLLENYTINKVLRFTLQKFRNEIDQQPPPMRYYRLIELCKIYQDGGSIKTRYDRLTQLYGLAFILISVVFFMNPELELWSDHYWAFLSGTTIELANALTLGTFSFFSGISGTELRSENQLFSSLVLAFQISIVTLAGLQVIEKMRPLILERWWFEGNYTALRFFLHYAKFTDVPRNSINVFDFKHLSKTALKKPEYLNETNIFFASRSEMLALIGEGDQYLENQLELNVPGFMRTHLSKSQNAEQLAQRTNRAPVSAKVKELELGELTKIDAPLFVPDELDIYTNMTSYEAFIFYGKKIREDWSHVRFVLEDFSLDVVFEDGSFQDLGVKVQSLVRPHLLNCHDISICRTEKDSEGDSVAVSEIFVPLIVRTERPDFLLSD